MRLAKRLAHAGVASRRAAEALIAEGRVTLGGAVVTDPARDVGDEERVEVDGRPLAAAESRIVFALHKPLGVISTARDTHGRRTVVELVPSHGLRLYPVGRLDADTSGLILLTNDGELANLLTHPRYEVPRTYRARVRGGPVGEDALRRLRRGVQLDDGVTAPARARRVGIRGGRGRSTDEVIELTVHEGKNHQVRRMCAAVGHPVLSLQRVAFGPLGLGRLAPGAHRRLSAAEVRSLRAAAAPAPSATIADR
ncbi:MAG TPA: pseudouridine synthase [Solirubrobacteraceae bacterium]|nr:pseudouridine synthase [Solirubrobacteraceae bacterium]